MTNKINETLSSILQIFKSGQIPEAVSYAAFPSFDIPSEHWSYLNRIIMWIHGTHDARGYRQWLEVGRHVKKGANAFHIFAPRLKKEKKENGDEDFSLLGYLQVPVFCYEDTEGEPLNYKKTKINSFHLIDKAKEWGLDVHAVSGNDRFWGSYDGEKNIKLATPEEAVFFHELSHHANKLVLGELVPGQNWKQEIVAELSAEALSRIFGLQSTTGNSYKYIERYAVEAGLTPVAACLQVLSDTEKVLKLILREEKPELKTPENVVEPLSVAPQRKAKSS